MRILFIGATGMLGKPVARELLDAGFELKLLARNPDKTRSLFPAVEVAKGDVFDRESLLAAMQTVDYVYCNLSVSPETRERDAQPEREGIENIIAAAKQSGIRGIVYLSSLVHRYEGMNGFHWWAFQIKEKAVHKIKNAGLPYLIFYPSTFMECLPYQMLRGKKLGIIGKSIMPMWFIAAADYGKQVAVALRKGLFNKEYTVQGTEAYTVGQIAGIFIANYEKARLSTLTLPIRFVRFLSLFSQRFGYAWRICEALNKYPERFSSERTWLELGKPVTTMAAFTKKL